MTKKLRKFKIGHGAYSGANALAYASGKAAAIRVLRERGVLRNAARDAVNAVCKSTGGYGYVTVPHTFDAIELAAA